MLMGAATPSLGKDRYPDVVEFREIRCRSGLWSRPRLMDVSIDPPLQQRNRIHIDKHTCGSQFSVLNVLPKPPQQMMKRRSRRRFDQQLLPVHAFDPL